MPAPGQMVALSPSFSPAVLKGIKLDPKDPFRFHFFVDRGESRLSQAELKSESLKLIKYFLASLTIPEKDLWVNLSPYEKDRIVPQEFGQTEMGRDLLAQDYILKQITASMIYPESQLGKTFWEKVYAQAQAKYGTTNIPVNTFNKVWIVPEKAVVYENAGVAFVLENHLKVMLEQDYLSLQKHSTSLVKEGVRGSSNDVNTIGSQIVREIVIPALTKEVNEGKNFAQLRQVFYSLILATWYKKKIKDSILNKVYSNRKKIQNLSSPNVLVGDPQHIYQQYLQAFKKGVYNYIKEEPTPKGPVVARKYFSGGVGANKMNAALVAVGPLDVSRAQLAGLDKAQLTEVTADAVLTSQTLSLKDHAMLTQQKASKDETVRPSIEHFRDTVKALITVWSKYKPSRSNYMRKDTANLIDTYSLRLVNFLQNKNMSFSQSEVKLWFTTLENIYASFVSRSKQNGSTRPSQYKRIATNIKILINELKVRSPADDAMIKAEVEDLLLEIDRQLLFSEWVGLNSIAMVNRDIFRKYLILRESDEQLAKDFFDRATNLLYLAMLRIPGVDPHIFNLVKNNPLRLNERISIVYNFMNELNVPMGAIKTDVVWDDNLPVIGWDCIRPIPSLFNKFK
ncbi:MAG: hypothetical protein WCH62_08735, partial [Candidatus Omnitrophota bacterium]